MTGFNHTLTGVLIGATMSGPIAPVVALLSHFVLDALPHYGEDPRLHPWNFKNKFFKGYFILDLSLSIAALVLGLVLFTEQTGLILLCAAMAFLPDLTWPLAGKLPKLQWFFDFHKRIQWGERVHNWPFDAVYMLLITSSIIIAKYI